MKELVARISAVLRRTGRPVTEPEILSVGNTRIEKESRAVIVDGKPVNLTPSEFDLLYVLMSAPDRVFSRSELMLKLQGCADYFVHPLVFLNFRRKFCQTILLSPPSWARFIL
jgi:DNA-binding response OmpR family regulator